MCESYRIISNGKEDTEDIEIVGDAHPEEHSPEIVRHRSPVCVRQKEEQTHRKVHRRYLLNDIDQY